MQEQFINTNIPNTTEQLACMVYTLEVGCSGRLLLPAHVLTTVEPLLEGHHWDSSKCPYKRGVLISGVVLCINVIIGTLESVLIGEVSFLEGCPYFRVSFLEGFHCSQLLTLVSLLNLISF